MKDFFSKNGIWILLVAVIVTVTMSVLSAFRPTGWTTASALPTTMTR